METLNEMQLCHLDGIGLRSICGRVVQHGVQCLSYPPQLCEGGKAGFLDKDDVLEVLGEEVKEFISMGTDASSIPL